MCITKDNKKQDIIEIGDRSLFFEETTGNTYKIDVEKDPVKLLLLKSNSYSAQDLINSQSQGFQGVAYRISQKNQEGNKNNKSSNHDMVCSDVVLIFDKDCLQPSKRCPYTEFCSTHPDVHIGKNDTHVLNLRNHTLEYVKK
jgi:hypothetical protein